MESLTKLKDGSAGRPESLCGIAHAVFLSSEQLSLNAGLDSIYNCHEDYVAAMLAGIETIENEPNLKRNGKAKVARLLRIMEGHFQMGFKKSSARQGVKRDVVRTWEGPG